MHQHNFPILNFNLISHKSIKMSHNEKEKNRSFKPKAFKIMKFRALLCGHVNFQCSFRLKNC